MLGQVRQLASAVRVGPPGADRGSYRRAPLRNEDGPYVLEEILGYELDQLEHLAAAGAFGAPDALTAQVAP